MESPTEFNGPCNLGNPNEFTNRELAEKVIAIIGTRSEIDEIPPPSNDPSQRKPNITCAKEYLDWQPSVQLDKGPLPLVEYLEQQLANSADHI